MGKFLTPLIVELIEEGEPARWRLSKPLAYDSDAAGLLVVPSGFVSDFASVPRLPLIFDLAGDTCHRAAVLHDWLYTAPLKVTRAKADAVLREASEAVGVPFWRRWLMWAAVRVGGSGNWQQEETANA